MIGHDEYALTGVEVGICIFLFILWVIPGAPVHTIWHGAFKSPRCGSKGAEDGMASSLD